MNEFFQQNNQVDQPNMKTPRVDNLEGKLLKTIGPLLN